MRTSNSACLVAIMRNEGPYVLEWVAHHRAVGFDRILVFTNACTDGTDRILDRLMAMDEVVHAPNPKSAFPQLGVWQVAALRYAAHFGAFKDSDWAMTVDADEFVDVSVGDGSISALIEGTPDFDLMSLIVVPYGCNEVDRIDDGQVIKRFGFPTISLADLSAGTAKARAVKTLMRPGIKGAHFRNHRPKIDNFSKTGLIWVDGSGRPMAPEFTDQKTNLTSAAGALDLAHVNHYSVRSRESFLLKCFRGDAVTKERLGLETDAQVANAITYWKKRHPGGTTEPHTPNRPAEFKNRYSQYLSDPALKALHEAALAAHAETLARILETAPGQTLAKGIGYSVS
ncbi:MAG: glycosyltransferase family 2 protein [Rhodobacteraceae bacterium]|nr:glycosyltransferase family 2 protein [Alphaproteobacteria bacterium]NNK67167.1 glycosyltransferase family 2 protein [Paracoccaceae bacterium]